MECALGDIFIYLIPSPDTTKQKPRPVLVISKPTFEGDVLVIVGSSQLEKWRDEHLKVVVRPEDLDHGIMQEVAVFPSNRQIAANPKFFHAKIGRLGRNKLEEMLRVIATRDASSFYEAIHKPMHREIFVPGKARIPYAARVFDEREVTALVDSSLDFWLTSGRYAERFEKEFTAFLGVRHCSLVNSGSSANLLAFMALTSLKLKERRIMRGDEVITVASGFPTTVTPIIQYGAVPVFVDVSLPTYNIDVSYLDAALSTKTKAVIIAHTLGNPFDIAAVKSFCDRHDLWLVEDNCDALGSKYLKQENWQVPTKAGQISVPPTATSTGGNVDQTLLHSKPAAASDFDYTGTFGHFGTSSFYPPHHITMGEGGAVYSNYTQLKNLVESFRDWGRDCSCSSGKDNTCGDRFAKQFGDLPYGYDHKYVYSNFGYNLKLTDMQAAIGCAQLEKLTSFIEARKKNWRLLRQRLAVLEDFFILPEATINSDPSWFGFLLTVREGGGLTRDRIVKYLESKGIQTRMLFAGNLIKHPCFDEMRNTGSGFRVVGDLATTDRIMRDSFWIGVYPGMCDGMLSYMVETIKGACR